MDRHIMLSYQWDSQALVRKVYRSLTNKGYNIWMDAQGGMTGNIYESMAFAVENSATIVCFMCESYERSENCKRELSYAVKQGVSIVPCVVQDSTEDGTRYSPSGWLGILTSSLLYISYRDKYSFKQSTEKLARELEQHCAIHKFNVYCRQSTLQSKFRFPEFSIVSLGIGRRGKFKAEKTELEEPGVNNFLFTPLKVAFTARKEQKTSAAGGKILEFIIGERSISDCDTKPDVQETVNLYESANIYPHLSLEAPSLPLYQPFQQPFQHLLTHLLHPSPRSPHLPHPSPPPHSARRTSAPSHPAPRPCSPRSSVSLGRRRRLAERRIYRDSDTDSDTEYRV